MDLGNLWRGHDYFYDAFAIREPLAPSSVSRLSQDIMGQHGGPKDFSLSGVNPNRSSIKILRNLASKTSWHGDFAPRAGERRDSGGKGSRKEQQQAMGANKRDVWLISTQPYKEAHFATFLEALVAIPLLAGTSEHGVCSGAELRGQGRWRRDISKIDRRLAMIPGPAAKTGKPKVL